MSSATWKQVVTTTDSGGTTISQNTTGTATGITTTLGIGNGGTGESTFVNGLLVQNDGAFTTISGSTGQVLVADDSGVPSFQSIVWENPTEGEYLTTTGNNSLSNLTVLGTFDASGASSYELDVEVLNTDANKIVLNHNLSALTDQDLLGLDVELSATDSSAIVYEYGTAGGSGSNSWKINSTDTSGTTSSNVAVFDEAGAAPTSADEGSSGVGSLWLNGPDLYIRVT